MWVRARTRLDHPELPHSDKKSLLFLFALLVMKVCFKGKAQGILYSTVSLNCVGLDHIHFYSCPRLASA